MKTVAFVPLKMNSRRLPGKNFLPVAGHPLCWHICRTLTQVRDIDEVYVYCSDRKVLPYLPEGIIFKERDKALDGDFVKGADIYRSFIEEVDADIYILAHATSPFIKVSSVENALAKVESEEYDSAFSAEKIQTFVWYRGKSVNYQPEDIPRTQDLEPVWKETSGFFIFRKEIFTVSHRRIGFHPYIQEVSGKEAVDIDEREDYLSACRMAETEEMNNE